MRPSFFYQYRPAPPLERFIERLVYWEGELERVGKDRLLPSGGCSLIINLAEDELRNYTGPHDDCLERYSGAVLVGAHARYSVIDTREQAAIVGVTFRPGGAWPFFAPAADELLNSHIDLHDLWRIDGRSLRERVLAEPTPARRLHCVERELLKQAIRPFTHRPEIEFALQRLSALSEPTSIERLSERCGLSARRFTRLFAIQVGLTPKLFARVQRFHSMCNRLGAAVDWSELAVECGYFDQPHLIRDCKLISGFTPSDLQSRWNHTGHHVPL
jgi:AraC-like DNA-binding protein